VRSEGMMINKINPDAEIGFDIPAVPGMAESEVQTPCLIVDLDRLEYNLKNVISFFNL
jgi:3-hydroxy-D-aspartate aldolase